MHIFIIYYLFQIKILFYHLYLLIIIVRHNIRIVKLKKKKINLKSNTIDIIVSVRNNTIKNCKSNILPRQNSMF